MPHFAPPTLSHLMRPLASTPVAGLFRARYKGADLDDDPEAQALRTVRTVFVVAAATVVLLRSWESGRADGREDAGIKRGGTTQWGEWISRRSRVKAREMWILQRGGSGACDFWNF
ncbi:hypothetical protein EDC01DRAFT_775404 [Geopyxis carbonaria]|nr:hypothetical protein EDC01DRAFT_775404 [Geopyxis carbonaria]